MKRELKKYLKKHLIKKKKNFFLIIFELICTPFILLKSSFSLKKILNTNEEDYEITSEKTLKDIYIPDKENNDYNEIYDYEKNNDFEDFTNKIDDRNIKNFIQKHNEYNDFQTTLFKMIDERKMKDSDVYNKVHIDRRHFAKIRNDKLYHPSKNTIILLGIALELNENELENLLQSASYALPKNNKYDLIIRFCFINKIYNIKEINELLEEYDCKLFNY